MAELSPDEKVEVQLVIRGANAFLELEQRASEEVCDLVDREDQYILWIVGLSSGAIAGVSVAPRFADISWLEAAAVFTCFGLSILSGAIYRWMLYKLETADRMATFNKQSSLTSVLFLASTAKTAREITDAKAQVKQIHEGKDPTYPQLDQMAKTWLRRANKLQFVPPGMFFLGVLALITVALVNWPSAPQPLPKAKPIPQLQKQKGTY